MNAITNPSINVNVAQKNDNNILGPIFSIFLNHIELTRILTLMEGSSLLLYFDTFQHLHSVQINQMIQYS